MMTFPDVTSLSLPAARALVHFLWQGLAVAGVAAIVLVCLRRSRPGSRYAVALVALVAMAAMPVLTVMSGPPIPMANSPTPPVWASSERATEAAAGTPTLASSGRADLEPIALLMRLEALVVSRPEVLVGAWLLGVFCLLMIHAGGVRRLRGLLGATTPAPSLWQATVRRLARSMGIRRPVELMESTAVDVPMTVGWLRPMIVVPASAFFGLAPQQLEAVLGHELAHVRRSDFLVNLFQMAMETLFFYHPAVWWLSRRVRIEREHCCDDLAVSVSGAPSIYVRALASLEEMRLASRAAPTAATPGLALGADGGSLLERVRRLAQQQQNFRATGSMDPRPGAMALGSRIFGTALAAILASLLAAAGVYLSDTGTVDAAPAAAAQEESEHSQADFDDDEDWDDWENRHDERDYDWVAEDSRDLRAAARGTQWSDLDDTTLQQLARWGFDEELFSALDRAGIAATSDQLEAIARYGVDEDLIDAVRRTDLSADVETLTSLGRYGVDGDDLLEYQRAGLSVSGDEILSFARYGLDGDDIAEFATAGYSNLAVEELLELARHGVDGDDVAEFAAAGYTDLSVDELVRLARHGVDGEDIQALARSGHAGLSVDEVVDLARYGLDGEDIVELQQAGLEGLSLDQFRELARHGVDGADVRELSQAGLDNLSYDEIMELARYGVDGDDVVELERAGLSDLSVEQIVTLARYGLDGDDLEEVREAGYEVTYEEVLRLARSGRLWLLDDDDNDDSDDWN